MPPVSNVTVTSDPVSPIHPFESPNVTLTCTVELSPAVDVPVTVNTVWTEPDGFMTNSNTKPSLDLDSVTTYTFTTVIRSFHRNHSGNYSCSATVTSPSPFMLDSSISLSDTKRITTGR